MKFYNFKMVQYKNDKMINRTRHNKCHRQNAKPKTWFGLSELVGVK